MATLNLGRIKPVFRGSYAGGTAYVVDDIVTSGDETFICILASTGNATSNATYWTKLAAKGTDGTDGTDLTSTLTTEGDLVFRDGSGLQRLAKGTAAQQLAMNSGATAPEWVNASSDCVKLGAGTISESATGSLDGFFTTDYDNYKVYINDYQHHTSGGVGHIRFNHSGSAYTSSNYQYNVHSVWKTSGGGGDGNAGSGWSTDFARWSYNNLSTRSSDLEITMFKPATTGTSNIGKKHALVHGFAIHQDGTGADYIYGGFHVNDVTAVTGLTLYASSGSNVSFSYRVYGFKN